MSQKEAALPDPLPVVLLRRGAVAMRSLAALLDDPRLELFTTDELTPEWISFAQRVAGVLVVTEGNPLEAFTYAATAEMDAAIVMLVARKHKADCDDLVAAGAMACAAVPVTTKDLDRIIPLLGRRAGSARVDTTLRLLLDPIGRTVRYQGKSVRLSQREFAVLHCLSTHGGRPVSAEELLTSVWGDAPSTDRTRQIVDVYIFQLRKKLKTLGLEGAISTVRSFGYALVQVTRVTPH